jgi:hypothetical protein
MPVQVSFPFSLSISSSFLLKRTLKPTMMQHNQWISKVCRILLILALTASLQSAQADPFIKAGIPGHTFWDDVGGMEREYCNNASTLYAVNQNSTLYTYQWYRLNFPTFESPYCLYPYPNPEHALAGATDNTYLPTVSGRYRCQVTDGGGQSYSTNSVDIYIHLPGLTISKDIQQSNIEACSGDVVSLTFVVHDDNLACQYRITYEWYADYGSGWEYISGATSSTYSFSPDRDAIYRCVGSSACGWLESNHVSVDFSPDPAITSHPVSAEPKCEGSSTNFSIAASGDIHQINWQFKPPSESNWTTIGSQHTTYSNYNTTTLTINTPSRALDGYAYRCIVQNTQCNSSAQSDEATLGILTPPENVTVTFPHDTVCPGASYSNSVTASGSQPFTYQWRLGSVVKSTSADFSIASVSQSDAGIYKCYLTNLCGINVPSEDASLNVWPPPVVSLGTDRHLCPGNSIVLDPGEYAWYEWNTGSFSRSITVSEGGSYEVTVYNDHGCSGNDAVYIFLDPSIPAVSLGPDKSFCMGEVPTLNAGAGYDSYLWSDGSTGRTIQPASSGTYWVRASSNNSVCIAGDTVHIQIAEPYNQERLCIVTVDLETGKNLLVWEKTHDAGIRYYNLWRETSIGQYEPIARDIPFDDLSIFSDTQVSPENRSYLYKISVTDTCGNESDLDSVPYHKPIFLKFVPSDQGVSLTWTNYEIQGISNLRDILTSYEIYRGTESGGLSFYTTVGSINDYLDTDPATATNKFYYRVAGVLSTPCSPSVLKKSELDIVTNSMSNLEYNRGVGTEYVSQTSSLLIYPNPVHEAATIRFCNPGGENYTLVITDLAGKIVRIAGNIHSDEFVLHRNDLGSGFYQVELAGRETFRAKLIIE